MGTLRALFACFVLFSSTAACSSQATEYCDAKCDCIGCNDANYDECVIGYDAQIDVSDAYGCRDDFDLRHECIMQKSDCILGNDVFDEAAIACVDDYGDLARCEDDASSHF